MHTKPYLDGHTHEITQQPADSLALSIQLLYISFIGGSCSGALLSYTQPIEASHLPALTDLTERVHTIVLISMGNGSADVQS